MCALMICLCCQSCTYLDPSSSLSCNDAGISKDSAHIRAEDSNLSDDRSVLSIDDLLSSQSIELASVPFIFSTTDTGFGINAVISEGDLRELSLEVRKPTDDRWPIDAHREIRGSDVAQWRVQSVQASTEYQYRLLHRLPDDTVQVLYNGTVRTRRNLGETFTFCMLADSHVYVTNPGITGDILSLVAQQILTQAPDFVIHLGDMLDFHDFGFNMPPPESGWTKDGYLFYRGLMGDLLGQMTHFQVIGNWEGENGDFTLEEIERSRSQRLLYLPGPDATTYPQGGSEFQDYYAFNWGDALFVILNVMTYTEEGHYLSGDIGLVDDWTLGAEQLSWLEQTLRNSSAKWKLLFIHHTVGGKAGDEANSAYGRGGGFAAYVGEQAVVHDMMREYGVQAFFYAHDHVFYDMFVDGIHYTIPGSAGAPWKFTSYETGYPEGNYWTDSGYGKVTVAPEFIDVAFINLDNQTIYSYTIE